MLTEIIIIIGAGLFWSSSCALLLYFLFIGKAQAGQNNQETSSN